MVTMPPDVVRTRASSTVFVNASRRVKRDLAGMADYAQTWQPAKASGPRVYELLRCSCRRSSTQHEAAMVKTRGRRNYWT